MKQTDVAQVEAWPKQVGELLHRQVGERIDSQPRAIEWASRHGFTVVAGLFAWSALMVLVIAFFLGQPSALLSLLYVALVFSLPLVLTYLQRPLYVGPEIRLEKDGLNFGLGALIPWRDVLEVSLSGVLVIRYRRDGQIVECVRPSPWRSPTLSGIFAGQRHGSGTLKALPADAGSAVPDALMDGYRSHRVEPK